MLPGCVVTLKTIGASVITLIRYYPLQTWLCCNGSSHCLFNRMREQDDGGAEEVRSERDEQTVLYRDNEWH